MELVVTDVHFVREDVAKDPSHVALEYKSYNTETEVFSEAEFGTVVIPFADYQANGTFEQKAARGIAARAQKLAEGTTITGSTIQAASITAETTAQPVPEG
jgi:hypothetical protein